MESETTRTLNSRTFDSYVYTIISEEGSHINVFNNAILYVSCCSANHLCTPVVYILIVIKSSRCEGMTVCELLDIRQYIHSHVNVIM